jgi:hypothetical protein
MITGTPLQADVFGLVVALVVGLLVVALLVYGQRRR